MPGVQEIGLPRGICWESHDEPGREPRRQGTAALSTQGTQPGSSEDNWWPLSLTVTLVCANPNPTSAQGLAGGDLCPTTRDNLCMGRGHTAAGRPGANPSHVRIAGPTGPYLDLPTRGIYHGLTHIAHPTGSSPTLLPQGGVFFFLGQVLISSRDPLFLRCFGCGSCPVRSQFTGAAALATSIVHPPQPRRVVPGPQGLSPLCFASEVSDRISAPAVLQADEESSTAEGVVFFFNHLTHLRFAVPAICF